MYLEFSIELPVNFSEQEKELLTYRLIELDFESFLFENRVIKAYKTYNKDNSEKYINYLAKEFKNCKFYSNIINIKNWEKIYKTNYKPVIIGKIRIIAPFHKKTKKHINIIIEPEMAFGTGHHPTTKMMIEFLLENDLKNKTIFDIGCGTGILSIIAEKLHAKKITSIDIDENAVRATLKNIKLNRCFSINVYQKNIKDFKPNEKFDYILANITRNTILNELNFYKKFLRRNGKIIISGFLIEDKDMIIDEFKKINLIFSKEKTCDIWLALEFIKK